MDNNFDVLICRYNVIYMFILGLSDWALGFVAMSVSGFKLCKKKHVSGWLRFKYFELFNLSLLARQARLILQNPDTLSVRILKAVCFPSTSILHAKLGTHPSQA